MIMAYVRVCYRTRCRFYVGDQRETWIKWRWAAPGALEYPNAHIFWNQHNDTFATNTDGVGEIKGAPVYYSTGRASNIATPGLAAHGTPEEFLGFGVLPEDPSTIVPPPCAVVLNLGLGGGFFRASGFALGLGGGLARVPGVMLALGGGLAPYSPLARGSILGVGGGRRFPIGEVIGLSGGLRGGLLPGSILGVGGGRRLPGGSILGLSGGLRGGLLPGSILGVGGGRRLPGGSILGLSGGVVPRVPGLPGSILGVGGGRRLPGGSILGLSGGLRGGLLPGSILGVGGEVLASPPYGGILGLAGGLVPSAEALAGGILGVGGGKEVGLSTVGPGYVPTDPIDGINAVYHLPSVPYNNLVQVALNGAVQEMGVDYTLSGAVITFFSPPPPGAQLQVLYFVFV
jgi:hypothetical protein